MRLGNPCLAVDSSAEVNGRWITGPEEWGPCRLLISGVESPAYRAAARTLKIDKMALEQREAALAQLAADHLLNGWEGMVDMQGVPVAWTREVCRAVMANRDNRRLVDFVFSRAVDLRTFDPAELADDVKN